MGIWMVAVMRRWIRRRDRRIGLIAVLWLLLPLAALTPVMGTGGSVQLSLQGYGTVPGELQNTIIQPNNTIAMTMLLNDQIETSNGPIQVTGSGVWNGVRNGSVLSGQIQGLAGKVQACVPFCLSADFVGLGNWNGELNDSSQGAGTLTGTVTFVSSSIPQIPVGQTYPISGTWKADFALPMPEFKSEATVYMIVLAVTALTIATTHPQQKPKNRNDRQSLDRVA
jgi:hypothetical protein